LPTGIVSAQVAKTAVTAVTGIRETFAALQLQFRGLFQQTRATIRQIKRDLGML